MDGFYLVPGCLNLTWYKSNTEDELFRSSATYPRGVHASLRERHISIHHLGACAAIRDVLKPLAVGDLSLRLYPTICTTQLV
jgi:hypothetical protein